MGKIAHSLRRLEGRNHHQENHDEHHVLGFHHEGKREHENLAVAVKQAEGRKHAVDAARRSDGGGDREVGLRRKASTPRRWS